MVNRVFVEKKKGFDIEANQMKADFFFFFLRCFGTQ